MDVDSQKAPSVKRCIKTRVIPDAGKVSEYASEGTERQKMH